MNIINYFKKLNSEMTSKTNFHCISDYQYTVQRFKKTFGYVPDLKNPKTFNEKLNWRKLYDHKTIFKIFADKIAVRKYVEDKIGNEILIKTLQIVNEPELINYTNLPQSFIIKASHGSGWNKIITNKDIMNKKEINDYFKHILKLDYYNFGREWCYKNLTPRLIVEELLIDKDGNLPLDYKFFCFNGVARFLQVDFGRFNNHTRNLYDPNLNIFKCQYHFPAYAGRVNPPKNFDQLKTVASRLSKGLDFIRVDLYSINNNVYFGELTCYPGNGYEKFEPDIYDSIFGGHWKIHKIS